MTDERLVYHHADTFSDLTGEEPTVTHFYTSQGTNDVNADHAMSRVKAMFGPKRTHRRRINQLRGQRAFWKRYGVARLGGRIGWLAPASWPVAVPDVPVYISIGGIDNGFQNAAMFTP